MATEELNAATQGLSLSEEPKTVLESREEFTVKHPLNSKWTLWYTKPPTDPNEAWSDLLKQVVTFDTIEEFWGVFHTIPNVSELPLKADYHLFREDIKPEWEDARNAEGGKWNYKFKTNTESINDVWTTSVLSVIGETIERNDNEESEVNGIVFNVRKGVWRIGLWTKSCDIEKLTPIGETFKKVLGLSEQDQVEFFPHKETSGKPKPIIVV